MSNQTSIVSGKEPHVDKSCEMCEKPWGMIQIIIIDGKKVSMCDRCANLYRKFGTCNLADAATFTSGAELTYSTFSHSPDITQP